MIYILLCHFMYQQFCSWENLLLAYRKASKGKRGHPNVAAFEYRLEDNLLQQKYQQMLRELAKGNISPGQVTASVQGWVNHVRYADTRGLRRAILTNL